MRRCFAAVMGLAMASAIMSSSESAWADPPGAGALPIHIVSLKTDDADEQAEALTGALKAEVRQLAGWSLAESDHSLELLTLGLRCPSPPDAACELRIADQIKADRFVWGVVKKASGNRVEGVLHLWTRSQGQTSANVTFSDNLTEANDDSLRKVALAALGSLTGGPPKGSVRLTAGDVNGQVLIDGQVAGTIHNGSTTLFVPVGQHKVQVRAAGYAPFAGEVTVTPNSTVALTLSPVTEEQAKIESSKPSTRKLAGYGAVAGGVLFGGLGLYSSLKVRSVNNDAGFASYRDHMAEDTDICDAAKQGRIVNSPDAASPGDVKDMCSTGRTYQVMQYVFYGLGAAAAGVGAYLILTDKAEQKTESARNVQILPAASPHGGSVGLRVAF